MGEYGCLAAKELSSFLPGQYLKGFPSKCANRFVPRQAIQMATQRDVQLGVGMILAGP